MVDKIVGALSDPADNHNVMLDVLGYDGQVSAYVLKQVAAGHKWAAGTICHSEAESSFVTEFTANRIFSAARSSQLKIAGFPNFMSVVGELQKSTKTVNPPEYSVCQALADGTLVIKQALLDLWITKHEMFAAETVPRCLLVPVSVLLCVRFVSDTLTSV